ncbi:MAG: hypothetical protein AB8B61_02620 [Cyclobacteriaceae bacterium]
MDFKKSEQLLKDSLGEEPGKRVLSEIDRKLNTALAYELPKEKRPSFLKRIYSKLFS